MMKTLLSIMFCLEVDMLTQMLKHKRWISKNPLNHYIEHRDVMSPSYFVFEIIIGKANRF